ncbi:MAG TPA: hypothetical protein VGZ29_09680 [Terriglobia bacterium]|nr:hypothetical protein [Terriglobia bacterium]
MRDGARYEKSVYRKTHRSYDALRKRTLKARGKGASFGSPVALVLLAVPVLFGPAALRAQRCSGKPDVGCTSPGAVCSPVLSGVGPFGHCTTPGGFPKGELGCDCVGEPAALDLNGIWTADTGAVYYVRQIGNDVWWAGFDPDPFSTVASKSNSFQRGLTSAQVFHGTLSGGTFVGDWAEVPRQTGSTLGQGTLNLVLTRDSDGSVVQFQTQSQTGGFAAKSWIRSSIPPLPCTDGAGKRDPYCLFAKVLKNQTESVWGSHESLLDNLKPYKDNAVVFGMVTQPYSPSLSKGSGLSCSDFFTFHDGDDDFDFDIAADRQNLDAQPGFWANGWINSASDIQGKLNAWQNAVRGEIIMFGRQNANCQPGDPVFLPGWAETGANSTLANGIPINAGFTLGLPVVVIPGDPWTMRTESRVRVTGPLVLDCGHSSIFHPGNPCYETDNDSGNLDTKNLEIHPVYSFDVLQDFNGPRPANLDLTGSWAASDVSTYYVRQIGNTVWWLGLSSDQGLTFANVFQGVIQANSVAGGPISGAPGGIVARAAKPGGGAGPPSWFPVISGSWASLPLGSTQGNGNLTLGGTFCTNLNDSTVPCDPTQPATAWNLLVTQNSDSPLFANPPNDRFQWQKLFDRNTTASPQIVAPADFNLGTVSNGAEATGSIPISNIGSATLIMQSISSNVLALRFSPATLTIPPQSSASISVTWLGTNRSGTTQTIYAVLGLTSNDPSTPHASVTLQLTVRGAPAN